MISSPDDVEVAVLTLGDQYTLLTMILAFRQQRVDFRIDPAFRPREERIRGRIIIPCYPSLRYLQKYRGILELANSVSEFDLRVVLPKKYNPTQLSFMPLKGWTPVEEGKTYEFKSLALPAF